MQCRKRLPARIVLLSTWILTIWGAVPLFAQNECSGATPPLFPVPTLIFVDSSGVKHQAACWSAALAHLTFPLTPSSGGTPGGASSTIQYNNAGSFGGITHVLTNGTTNIGDTTNAAVLTFDTPSAGGLSLTDSSGGQLTIGTPVHGTDTVIAEDATGDGLLANSSNAILTNASGNITLSNGSSIVDMTTNGLTNADIEDTNGDEIGVANAGTPSAFVQDHLGNELEENSTGISINAATGLVANVNDGSGDSLDLASNEASLSDNNNDELLLHAGTLSMSIAGGAAGLTLSSSALTVGTGVTTDLKATVFAGAITYENTQPIAPTTGTALAIQGASGDKITYEDFTGNQLVFNNTTSPVIELNPNSSTGTMQLGNAAGQTLTLSPGNFTWENTSTFNNTTGTSLLMKVGTGVTGAWIIDNPNSAGTVNIEAGTTPSLLQVFATGAECCGGAGPMQLANGLSLSSVGNIAIANGNPTIASGFGTTPSIVTNLTASFAITIGTGGTATSGVLTMPAATDGWAVYCADVTTQSTTVFITKQIASSTTSVTLANYNTSGAQAAWAAGDKLECQAMAN
jgi:hypothetical protein